MKAIKRKDIKTGNERVVNYNRVYKVPVPKPVGVPTPTIYNVPYVRYEYYPVEEKKEECNNPCCCGGNSGGIAKIVNHTSVNWISGSGKMKKRGFRNRDPNDSSSEEKSSKSKAPRNWADVVARFNKLNGETNQLVATGSLSGKGPGSHNQLEEARKNYERLVSGDWSKIIEAN